MMSTTTLQANPNKSLMESIAGVYQRYLRGEISIHRYSSMVDELIERNDANPLANAH